MNVNRQELDLTREAFVGQLERRDHSLLLRRSLLAALFDVLDVVDEVRLALRYDFRIKAVRRNGKHCTVEGDRHMHLVPSETDGRHNVRRRVRLREHVLDLLTGADIPFGHVVRAHLGLPFGRKTLTLSHRLHDLEGERVLESVADQVVHDVVSTSDNVRNIADALFNEVLRVIRPNVGTVRESGNLQKVGKVSRLCLLNHLHNESRTEFGQTAGAEIGVDILGRNAERFRREEQLVHRLVVHRNVHNARIGESLDPLILRRHIVSKLVKLQKRVVQIFKGKVRRDDIGGRVIGGMLYRAEIVDLVFLRHNDDTAGMLARRALNADAMRNDAVHFHTVDRNALAFKILRHVAVRRLVRKSADRSRAENVFRTEELLGIFMYLTLHLTREVQVNIGRLIAVEAEEGFERDIVTVIVHFRAAVRAVLRREVKARADAVGVREVVILTIRAPVVRRERIYLRNTRHRGNEGRAYRASRADEIPLTLAVPNELLRDHIENGKAVLDDRGQLLVQTLRNHVGERITVHRFCSLPANALEILLRAVHVRRKGSLREGTDIFVINPIGDHVGVLHDHLVRLFLAEIRKFLEHFLGRTVIEVNIAVGVGELLSRKQNLTVQLVRVVHEMRVTGCNDGNIQLFAQSHDLTVEVAKPLLAVDLTLGKQEAVIADRLNLKVIVELCDFLNLTVGLALDDGLHQFARLAGRADDQPFSVFFKSCLRNSREPLKIIQIAFRNQAIKILQSHLVFHQNDLMIGFQLQRVGLRAHFVLQIGKAANVLRLHLFHHGEEDHRQHLRVVAGAVVIEVSELKVVGKRIQLVIFQLGIQISRQRNRVEIRIFKGNFKLLRVVTKEARVKVRIVCNKEAVAAEREEFRKNLLDSPRVLHHVVGDARQLDDLLGDRLARIHEGVVALENLAVLDFDRTDFGDLAGLEGQTRRFDVENDEFVRKGTAVLTVKRTRRIVHEVGLDTVNDVLTDLLGGQHRVLEALHVSVVGDGHGAVSPPIRGLDRHVGRNQRVHIRHHGVQMQLYALFLRVVHAVDALDLCNVAEEENEILRNLTLTRIVFNVSAHCVGSALGEVARQLLLLVKQHIVFSDLDRCVSVGQTKGRAIGFAAARGLGFIANDVTHDGNVSLGLRDRRNRHGTNLKGLADHVIGTRNIKPRVSDAHLSVHVVVGGRVLVVDRRNALKPFPLLLGRRGGRTAVVTAVGCLTNQLVVMPTRLLDTAVQVLNRLHVGVAVSRRGRFGAGQSSLDADAELRQNDALNDVHRLGVVKKADAAARNRDFDIQSLLVLDGA